MIVGLILQYSNRHRMIRRKVAESSEATNRQIIRKGSKQPSIQLQKSSKFNYQLEQLSSYQTFQGHLPSNSQLIRQEAQSAQNKKIAGESRLKRKQLYVNLDVDASSVRIQQPHQAEQQAIEGELKGRVKNDNKMVKQVNGLVAGGQLGKTIRKKDQFCSCFHGSERQKQELIMLQSQQVPTDNDLDAKYQQIWKSNQQGRDRSFISEDVENFTVNNLQGKNIVVNVSNHLKRNYPPHKQDTSLNYQYGWNPLRMEKENRGNSSFQHRGSSLEAEFKGRSSSGLEQYRDRNRQEGFIRRRGSVARRQTRVNSPMGRSRARRGNYRLEGTYSMLDWPQPQKVALPECPCPPGCVPLSVYDQQGEERLRLVEQFSQRISVRIRELTLSMEEMRRPS